MRENTEQKTSRYGYFSRSVCSLEITCVWCRLVWVPWVSLYSFINGICGVPEQTSYRRFLWNYLIMQICKYANMFHAKIYKDQFRFATLVLIQGFLFHLLSLKLIHDLTGNCSWKLVIVSRIGKCWTEKNDSILNIKKRPCK